jgi:hypothetical protein
VSSWVFEAAHLLTRLDSNVQLYCDIQIAVADRRWRRLMAAVT